MDLASLRVLKQPRQLEWQHSYKQYSILGLIKDTFFMCINTSSGFPYISGSITERPPICVGSEPVAAALGTGAGSTLVLLGTDPADGLIPVMPTAAGTSLTGGIPAEDPAHCIRRQETSAS